MPSKPSIKGSAIVKVVEDATKLINGGDLSRAEAERWLQPEDLALLGKEVVISRWYDIGSYARMTQLLLEVVGHGDPEYLRERGRLTARRLLEAGLYAQFEYLQHTEVAQAQSSSERYAAFGRDLRILNTMSANILSFSKWTAQPDPLYKRRYVIEVTEAQDYPEVLCWTSDGLVNEMAAQHGNTDDLWHWKREAPDRIVFRMNTDI
jgi:hypothetical protein